MTPKNTHLLPWKLIQAEPIFQAAPWITVERQIVELPDGRRIDDYHFIDVGSHACSCVFTPENKMVFVRHYRHGVGRVCLGLPAGAVNEGETPIAAAQRELLEETGYVADNWVDLGAFVEHGNYGCGRANFFVATNARVQQSPDSGDLEEMAVELLDLAEFLAAVRAGDVPLMGTVAAVLLAVQQS